jgi:hypothetical protein
LRFFIDETFQLADKEHHKPFYALAAIGLPEEEIEPVREFLKARGHGDPLHGTELLRSESGHKELLEITRRISHKSVEMVTSCAIEKNDHHGEYARAKLIRTLVSHILTNYPDTKQILFEARLTGYEGDQDAKTFREIRKQLEDANIKIGQAYKTQEPLLWAADLLATSYRQLMTRAIDRYFDAWQAEVVIP